MPVTARAAVRHVLLLAALAGAAACGDKVPTAPSSPSVGPYALTVDGTLSLHQPGDSSQLTLTATFPGGNTKDVTRDAFWSCKCAATLANMSAGLVTARAYGKGEILVTYATLFQSIPVRVAPEGVFLIEGTVTNARQSKVADVEVTSASGTYSTTSDASGRFDVPAVGPTTLRVSMSGYDTVIRQMTVNQDDQVIVELQQSARLPPVQARPFSGRYTLTFVASPSCALDLPAEARQRTYGAYVYDAKAVWEEPWDMDVSLDGATFAILGMGGEAGFIGTLDGNTVRFPVGDDPSGYYTFIELVGDLYMSYRGTATGTVTDRAILTTFNGRVELSAAAVGGWTVAGCTAADHRLEFGR